MLVFVKVVGVPARYELLREKPGTWMLRSGVSRA